MPESTQHPSFTEVGVSGVREHGGVLQEEFLVQLQGHRGRRVYREMGDNGGVISAFLYAIEMFMRSVSWHWVPAESAASDVEREAGVLYMEGIVQDMSHAWVDFIADISYLIYGWAFFEIVWKRRLGPDQEDPAMRSMFDDGQIGVRKLALRRQNTLDRWLLDDHGGVQAMVQQHPKTGQRIPILIDTSLLFRAGDKQSPEGRSLLRTSYRPWYFLKNIEEVEAIGIERELNGLPVISVPNSMLKADATPEEKAALEEYKRMGRDTKLNDQAAVIIPSDHFRNKDGTLSNVPMVKFELAATKGQRSIDTNKVALRYETKVARNVLAEFLMLGGTDTGAYNMHVDKSSLFILALEGLLGDKAETCNRHFTPKVWRRNSLPRETMPRLVPGKVAPEDLAALALVLKDLSQSGMPLFPDEMLESEIQEALVRRLGHGGAVGETPGRDA